MKTKTEKNRKSWRRNREQVGKGKDCNIKERLRTADQVKRQDSKMQPRKRERPEYSGESLERGMEKGVLTAQISAAAKGIVDSVFHHSRGRWQRDGSLPLRSWPVLLQSSSQQIAGLNEAIVLDGAPPDVVLMKTKPRVTCQPATINYALICSHTLRLRQGHTSVSHTEYMTCFQTHSRRYLN